jgi:hypothetical protein
MQPAIYYADDRLFLQGSFLSFTKRFYQRELSESPPRTLGNVKNV